MSNGRKMIGICMAQAHTFLKTDLLSALNHQARER